MSDHLLLDGCGCLTSEEHMTRCVLAPRPLFAAATAGEHKRRVNRERVARWKAAHPERWREIQRTSEERRKVRRAA